MQNAFACVFAFAAMHGYAKNPVNERLLVFLAVCSGDAVLSVRSNRDLYYIACFQFGLVQVLAVRLL